MEYTSFSLQIIFVLLICKMNLAEESALNEMPDYQPSQEDEHFYGVHFGIPFRQVRKIGSEFLGKRTSYEPDEDDYYNSLSKRLANKMDLSVMAKRRLGSEFLGKRNAAASIAKSYEKRALGSEFLGKRRIMPYDFSWKRARLGSEFLGKRALGSEFLGKRVPF